MTDVSRGESNGQISETAFRSLDGLHLRGTLVVPPEAGHGAVLVHGGGVTREEGGFFSRLASALASAGVASLRFDLRGHGKSEGQQNDLTLCGVANDIQAAVDHLGATTEPAPVSLVGTSFSGGISALFASRHHERIGRLVLLNPLLNYKKRFIDDKPYWTDDRIAAEAGRELSDHGFIAHSPSFKLGRALLNEVFHVRPDEALERVVTPTLIVHGTRDTFIPVESSRECVRRINAETKLVEIEGAQHGFAVHDDPGYVDPQTQRWQASVIKLVVEWITRN